MNTNISEDFIHYIWKIKNFDLQNLLTTSGDQLEILKFGTPNSNSGPDFLNGSIQLSNTKWFGHIEMHINSSDWDKHKHTDDPAYQNVILHVVLNHDKTILIGENPIPTLELRSRIKPSVYNAYNILNNSTKWIPCQSWLQSINDITISSTIDNVLAERLTSKSKQILEELSSSENDWQEIIYQRLFWSFGLSVNAESFLKLSKLLPYKLIQKHRESLEIVESLLFGTAGLLEQDIDHDYIVTLKNHYRFYQKKYDLTKMRPVEWKFMRMRPSGFPTVRIVQLAQFLCSLPRLDNLIFSEDYKSIYKELAISINSGFWFNHYNFNSDPKPIKKSIGIHKINSILINSVAPLKYAYGIYNKSEIHKSQSIDLLEAIPSETNSILSKWKELGVKSENAAISQALIQLKKSHCSQNKCLQCSIGHQVFKQIERG